MSPSFDGTPEPGAERLTIAVAGSDALAIEICRLGRAAGHDVVSLSAEGRPERDEPWIHGVEWAPAPSDDAAAPSVPEGTDVLVALSTARDLAELYEAVGELAIDEGPRRLVQVVASTETPTGAPERSESLELRLPPIADPPEPEGASGEAPPPDPTGDAIPVGQAAMAILRAAVEPDREGRLDPDEVAELGRSVMIQ